MVGGDEEDAKEKDGGEQRSTSRRRTGKRERRSTRKMQKKETGEFVFDGGGNIDSVLGAVEEEKN